MRDSQLESPVVIVLGSLEYGSEMVLSWSVRTNSHAGTEIRSRLFLEAAVGNPYLLVPEEARGVLRPTTSSRCLYLEADGGIPHAGITIGCTILHQRLYRSRLSTTINL